MFDITKHKSQLQSLGVTKEDVLLQLERLTHGSKPLHIQRPATIGDGILRFDKEKRDQLTNIYDSEKNRLSITRFVPASGMATRMFKFLYYFLDQYNPNQETIRAYLNRKKTYKLGVFLGGIEKLPFYKEFQHELSAAFSDDVDTSAFYHHFIRLALEKYGNKPKALVPFHRYSEGTRSAFEEQLRTSMTYAVANNSTHHHFTISEAHHHAFMEQGAQLQKILSEQHQLEIHIDYSVQLPKTDTLTVDHDNIPVLDKNKNLIFRAGGHGALIENLNQIQANVIFISNIDNVTVENRQNHIGYYKKVLAGCMLEAQKTVFKYLDDLEAGASIAEAKDFLQNNFHVEVPSLSEIDEREFVIAKLQRPIRVCGMVPNENEAGGGPFWVLNLDQSSLQIVEQSQMDLNNPKQMKALQNGTHFNPVDIVCGVYNHKGEKFDLTQFVDSETYFVSEKSLNGKPVKVLEHPGLWNGAMADWNTIFVEVPISTFNPVKNVNDLLRLAHQV